MKPGLPWRTQDVRNVKGHGIPAKRAANREWIQPKRKKCAVDNKAGQSWRSEERFDMEMQSLVFVQLVFSLDSIQYFLTILPFLHFGMVKYILCYYMLEVFYFYFYGWLCDYS